MTRWQDRKMKFEKRPYLDPRIDRWKVLLLTLLFLLLVAGALTWIDGVPWTM
jgi:hypothetical protein